MAMRQKNKTWIFLIGGRFNGHRKLKENPINELPAIIPVPGEYDIEIYLKFKRFGSFQGYPVCQYIISGE